MRSTANKSVELSRAFPTSTISMGNEFAAVRSAPWADAPRRSLQRRCGDRSGALDLRALLPSAIWNRLTAEVKALMETEEGRQKFDSMFGRSA